MRYVIIGNSAAGNAAAQAIRTRDPGGEVTLIGDEARPAYYRPLIPFLIDRERPEADLFRDALHLPQGVTLHLGRRATRINPSDKTVLLDDGEQVSYDQLLLATGSSAVRPPIVGVEGPGVFVLRQWDDALAVRQAAAEARQAVVVGGGLVSMEAAEALLKRSVSVTLVVSSRQILSRTLDDTAAEMVRHQVETAGVRVMTGCNVVEIRGGVEAREVVLDTGQVLPTGLVVIGKGVVPNVELARNTPIAVRRGILVDRYQRTSVAGIYAAGDVAETADIVTGENIVSGTWTNATEMGRIAGENMAGGAAEYEGAFRLLNAKELFGIPVISVGVLEPPPEKGYRVYASRRGDTYRKLVLRDNVLAGALLVGEVEGAGVFTGLIKRRADLGDLAQRLAEPYFSYAPFLRLEEVKADAYAC
jgi:NAD(P)H-nitrite reductase large subunit